MCLAINITFSVPASTIFCLADQHVHNFLSAIDCCRALDAGDEVDVVFVDLRKAFDVVPHVKLIAKFEAFDICCKTLRWIRTFLKGRKQTVRLNGKISNLNSVVSGVVQGSILGPLLFTFYVNDLPTACPECIIKLYADDSKVYKLLLTQCDRNCSSCL